MIILMEKTRAREDIQCVAVHWVGGLSGSLWVRPCAHAIHIIIIICISYYIALRELHSYTL